MAEVKWIKIYVDMFDNKKIKFIRSLPEGNDILLTWIMLLSSAGKCNSNGFILLTENVPYTIEMLSHEYAIPLSTVQLAIQTLKRLNMVNDEDGAFCITSWEEYQNVEGMEKIREQTKARVSRHRQKRLCNATSNATVTQGNAIELDIDKDIDKEIDIDINTPIVPKGTEDFNTFWQSYPKKVGKGAAEKVWKKIKPSQQLLTTILLAIQQQQKSKGWLKDDGQFIPNPATWLNQKRWEDEPELQKQNRPKSWDAIDQWMEMTEGVIP